MATIRFWFLEGKKRWLWEPGEKWGEKEGGAGTGGVKFFSCWFEYELGKKKNDVEANEGIYWRESGGVRIQL